MIKKSAFSSFGALFLLLVPFPIHADEYIELPPIETHDISLQIRAIAGMAHYEYQDIFLQNIPLEDVSDYVFLAGFGTRFNYDNFFADFYYQDSSIENEHTLIKDKNFPKDENHPSVNFSRRDWAITTGYTFWENTFLGDVSAFGGYKSGKTSLNTIQTRFIENTPTITAAESETHFEAKDYFLGLANSWQINSLPWINSWRWIKDGRLGFNAAVARLKGDYTIKANSRSQIIQTESGESQTQTRDNISAPTIGYRFGLNWSYPISNEFGYTISLEYYNYRMEGTREGQSFPVDEELFGVKASLVYTFDPRKLW